MPTINYFKSYPIFPADLPLAAIPKISLESLQQNTGESSKDLFNACIEHGFFVLHLSGHDGRQLLQSAESMFDLTSSTFELDSNELLRYAYQPPKSLLGYKKPGLLRTADGGVDDIEMYTLGQDDIMGNVSKRSNPSIIEERRETCKEFLLSAHKIIAVILKCLDIHLGLQPGTLDGLCAIDKQSETSLRLLKASAKAIVANPRAITLGGHTDIGTITLLFNVVGGLQILSRDNDASKECWRFIKPEPEHALINIGDTLVEWSGGLLRSSLHRVIQAPGEQAQMPRLSMAYLVRAENNALIQRLESDVIPPSFDDIGDTRTVREWAIERTGQIMRGDLTPRSHGGRG